MVENSCCMFWLRFSAAKTTDFVLFFSGRCICQQGYTGSRCDRPCPKGFYGVGCKQACLPCTSGKKISIILLHYMPRSDGRFYSKNNLQEIQRYSGKLFGL